MLKERIERLKNIIRLSDVDALLIEDKTNRFYVSNFIGTAGIAVVTGDNTYLITDFRYTEKAKQETKYFEIIEYKKNVFDTLNDIINDNNINTIGVNYDKMTLARYNQISKKLPDIKFVDKSNILNDMRKIKDENEIKNIMKAQEITDRAFLHILKYIKPGIRERDIEIELDYFMKKNGAKCLAFDSIIASGKRSSLPHGIATEKKIETNDLLTMDFGCVYNEYCSDMTRTIGIGHLNKKSKDIYNIVYRAQTNAINRIVAGISCGEADGYAREIIEKEGFGKNFGHGLGHGVGLEIHESPTLSSSNKDILEVGMIITIEPGIYIEHFGGVRIENMGVVTEKGLKIFTSSTKELIIL